MKFSVTAIFRGEPGGPLEQEAVAIFEAYPDEWVGQGTDMTTGERDVQYVYASELFAHNVAKALYGAGYRVSRFDYDQE